MCNTTPKTKAASPAVVTPGDIPDKTITIIPFQKYLDKVSDEVKNVDHGLGPDFGQKTHVPISIFLRSKGSIHTYGGIFDEEHHFSGSLIKVAAMFAAFKLRREALLLAEKVKNGTLVLSTPPNQAKFFNKLDEQFDPNGAVPGIASRNDINKRPKYAEILSVTGFPNLASINVEFTPGFKNHIRQMIVPSNNCSAGECIVTLSFPYINVKLMEDGFFDGPTWNTPAPKGIWLCGDYIDDSCSEITKAKKQQYIRITTVNDCDEDTHFCGSAQNTSSKEMARLFLKILLEELVDPDSSRDMRVLLEDGQKPGAPHTSYITRLSTINLLFDIDAVKVGFGPIKKDTQRGIGLNIRSEGILIKWKTPSDAGEAAVLQQNLDKLNLTGEGAICWQNFPENLSTNGIAKIINTSIDNFIKQKPI
jgi:hypothetical protein